jgi:PX domain-containing protein kinase-like protein
VDCEWFSSDNNKSAFSKLLLGIENPYVMPCVGCEYYKDRSALVVYRSFSPKGSLRDYIHNAKPSLPYGRKYTQTTGHPLPEQKIAKYGREILEGIDSLHSHGYPFNNLHAGNVILDNGVCRVSDFEADLIGLPPKYQTVLQAHRDKAAPIVVCFGCTLYEMAVGYEMDSVVLDDLPADCNPKVKKILKAIFQGEGSGFPTLRSLIANPFFAEVKLYSEWVPGPIKMSARTKQLLQSTAERFERELSPTRSSPK